MNNYYTNILSCSMKYDVRIDLSDQDTFFMSKKLVDTTMNSYLAIKLAM